MMKSFRSVALVALVLGAVAVPAQGSPTAGIPEREAKPKPRTCRTVVRNVRGKPRKVRVCRAAVKPKPKPKARNVAVTVDAGRAATATVGAAGGTVTASRADGTTFALAIPAGALERDVAISVTPVTALRGVPRGVRLLAAAQLAPDGLALARPATLTVALPAARTGARGLAWFGAGKDAHRYPVAASARRLTVRIAHVSGAGATAGPVDWLPTAETALTLRFAREVRPLMRVAETDDTQLARAFAAAFGWEREVELLGLGERFATWKAEIRAWLPRALRNAIDKASARCTGHDLTQVARLLALERFAQLMGVAVPGGSGLEHALRCARFELDFSTVHRFGSGHIAWDYRLAVHGLKLDPTPDLARFAGEKPLDSFAVSSSCGPLLEYGGVLPARASLTLDLDLVDDGEAKPLGVVLELYPGNVVGWFSCEGVRLPSLASTVTFGGFFHADEIEANGLFIRNWELVGGEVVARKTYDRTVVNGSGAWPERTTLVLRHTPGP